MANEISYFDTPYTFINPVRYFKANDPYYYEVDNIPIKQLEETSNFLKDQVDGLLNKPKIEIDRSGFSELKPYATGNDRKVRVKPGRYTARINNAFDITPLQTVAQIGGFASILGSPLTTFNEWEFETINGATVSASLDEFQAGLVGTAYMMNGLYERAFVYPVGDGDGIDIAWNPWKYLGNKGLVAGVGGAITTPGYNPPAYGLGDIPGYPSAGGELWRWAPYPNYTGIQPLYHVAESTTAHSENLTGGVSMVKAMAKNQGTVESMFIKRWRGAIRTSIVDVPEELDISIPDYDENDFFYFDTNGDKQFIDSNQRIDLLFVYSKAIDETTTTINKFDINGNPQPLERATLGILKGAGVGISRQLDNAVNSGKALVDIRDAVDGTPLMFSHPGDHGGNAPDNVGFSTSAGIIKGSFPSPDDLMNLAPVLSENLELNSLPLIGQSILPIAYIIVRNPTGGGPILNLVIDEDIIDIRPFFRTTELAYNERAGIAAATPQISIANPVVSEAHLEEMRQEIITPIDGRLATLESIHAGGGGDCRIIAAGQVLGGFWGPEGALIRHAKGNTGGGILTTPMSAFVDLVESEFNYKPGSVPYFPDWDKALWYGGGGFTGDRPCDHINVGAPWLSEIAHGQGAQKWMPPFTGDITGGGTYQTVTSIEGSRGPDRFGMFGWGPEINGQYTVPFRSGNVSDPAILKLNHRYIQINYVSKKIKLNFDNTNWVEDYHVKINLLHCVPLPGYGSIPAIVGYHGVHPRPAVGTWVQKFKDYFVVNVAWAAAPLYRSNQFNAGPVNVNKPWADRSNPENYAGFVQPYMQGLGSGGVWGSFPTEPAGYAEGFLGLNDRRANFDSIMNGPPNTTPTAPEYLATATPLLYPSVQWEVVGIGSEYLDRSLGTNGQYMHGTNPTVYTF